MARSQNGYRANTFEDTKLWFVPGTDRHFRLRRGAPGFVLVWLLTYFHENIEPLDEEQVWDDWGYAERDIRGSDVLSNHASGTAADANAMQHPLGARGTFSSRQERRIRWMINVRLRQVVRWGGEYQNRPDEMHFELNPDIPHSILKKRVVRRATRLRNTRIGKRVLAANREG